MKGKLFLILIGSLTLLQGCVSIATHERKMRMCRMLEDEKAAQGEKLEEVEAQNEELEMELEDSSQALAEKERKISEIESAYEGLLTDLKEDIAAGLVGVTAQGGVLKISMGNKVLFRSGQANLQPKGRNILASVSKTLVKLSDYFIRVDGHSDNIPIKGNLQKRYPTNWELSAARSGSVVRFLESKGSIPSENLILTSFASNRPLASNKTAEGRRQNRRVEILLIKKSLLQTLEGVSLADEEVEE